MGSLAAGQRGNCVLNVFRVVLLMLMLAVCLLLYSNKYILKLLIL